VTTEILKTNLIEASVARANGGLGLEAGLVAQAGAVVILEGKHQ
jgi:hypothetical protein